MARSRSWQRVKRSRSASSMVGHKRGPVRRAWIASTRAGAALPVTFPIFASRIEQRAARRGWSWALAGALLGYTCLSALPSQAAGAPKLAEHLPELPAIPSLELPRPTPAELEELDTRLAKLCSSDAAERDAARREVLEVTAKAVPALRFRLAATADSTKHDELKELLLKIRKKARDDARDEQAEEGKRGRVKTPDYFEMAIEHAEPKSKLWCSLASVLAESRMLAQIGTVEAVRGLIDVYVRYGEFLRVDTQLQLEALGDRAVPALIEARRHPAEKIVKWSARELDALGKAIPSEAVQMTDLQVLSDVLRAFGRVRDPDAARIVVSFSNSERAQVREASRQAIAMLGEVGAWQLRDTYETVVGKKPPRDWNWERTAREHGDLEAMRRAFDQVLTRNPDYPKQSELANAYLDYAQKNLAKSPQNALSALRRVERLAKDGEAAKTATSLRLTLEAENLADSGIADRTLLARALEIDPKNSRARDGLARFERGEVKEDDSSRYYGAAAIGLVALGGIAVVLLRGRRTEEKPAEPNPAEPNPTEPNPAEPNPAEPN